MKPDGTVGPGDIGQLIVRGPQMMSGYWNDPEQTAKKIRDGWLYTGNLFTRAFFEQRPANVKGRSAAERADRAPGPITEVTRDTPWPAGSAQSPG